MIPPKLNDNIVTMSRQEFEQILEDVSNRAAKKALADIGLEDEHAGQDIHNLRELLKAFRTAKKEAFRAFIKWFTIGALTLLLAGIFAVVSK